MSRHKPKQVKALSSWARRQYKNVSKLGRNKLLIFVLGFAVIASLLLIATHASAPTVSVEPESGSSTLNSPAVKGTDTTASGGGYVKFQSLGGGVTASKGVYVADFFNAPITDLAKDPQINYINGFVQAYKWSVIEPSNGSYDWTHKDSNGKNDENLDADIQAAYAAHKKIGLAIDTGAFTPAWADPQFLTFIISSHNGAGPNGAKCQSINVPIPWDSTYQANLHSMIQALTSHLKATRASTDPNDSTTLYDVVSQVKLTGITEDTEETRMPSEAGNPAISGTPDPGIQCTSGVNVGGYVTDAPSTWKAAGYTRSKAEQAWKTMAGYWAAAFSDKTLGHPTIATAAFPNIDDSGTIQYNKDGTYKSDTQTTHDLINFSNSTWGKQYMLMQQALSNCSNEPTTSYGITYAAQNRLQIGVGFQLQAITYGNAAPDPKNIPSITGAVSVGINGTTAGVNGCTVTSAPYHMTYLEIFSNVPTADPAGTINAYTLLNL